MIRAVSGLDTTTKLDNKLAAFVNDIIFVGDSFFFKMLYDKSERKNFSPDEFVNKTQHECFINQFLMHEYATEKLMLQALLFSDALIEKWNELKNGLTLQIIIGGEDYNLSVNAHILREGDDEIVSKDNMQIYHHPMLLRRSGDDDQG